MAVAFVASPSLHPHGDRRVRGGRPGAARRLHARSVRARRRLLSASRCRSRRRARRGRGARVRARGRRVRRDDHVRRQPARRHADAVARDLRALRRGPRRRARVSALLVVVSGTLLPRGQAAAHMDIASPRPRLPLRSFDLELSARRRRRDRRDRRAVGRGQDDAPARASRAGRGPTADGSRSATRSGSTRAASTAPEERDVGFVFQDYALFPHLSVRPNVAFGGADRRRAARALRHRRARERAAGELSGGERQRVALARRSPAARASCCSTSRWPHSTRTRSRASAASSDGTCAKRRWPTLLVTHDYDDAAALADRVGVLIDGSLVQTGTPAELIAAPASPFVAEFTGATCCVGWARRTADGLTEVVLDGGQTCLPTATRPKGRVGRRRASVGDLARARAPRPTRCRTTSWERSRASSRSGNRCASASARSPPR